MEAYQLVQVVCCEPRARSLARACGARLNECVEQPPSSCSTHSIFLRGQAVQMIEVVVWHMRFAHVPHNNLYQASAAGASKRSG